MKNKPTIKGWREKLKKLFPIEASICKDCGHGEDLHYWNGGGNLANSGYDRCRHKGCECISENFEIKIIGYEETKWLEDFIQSELVRAVEGVEVKKKDDNFAVRDYRNGYNRAISDLKDKKKEILKQLES
jgi:hypothetical protein